MTQSLANSTSSGPRRSAILISVLFGLLLGTTVWWTFPPASAASPADCTTVPPGGYATNASDSDTQGHHGTQSGAMFIYDYNALCDHISSLVNQQFGGSGDFVEIGWADVDDNVHPNKCKKTDGSDYYGNDVPHLFYAYTLNGVNNFYKCVFLGGLTGGQSDGFSLKDFDGNSQWTLVHSSQTVTTLNLLFSYSKSNTNAERHSSSESSKGLFDQLKFMNSLVGWQSWADAVCAPSLQNPDPGWNNQLLSNTKVQVTTAAADCVS